MDKELCYIPAIEMEEAIRKQEISCTARARLDDITVLQAAAAFEEASPWAQKRPPID